MRIEVLALPIALYRLTGGAVCGEQTDFHQFISVMRGDAVYTIRKVRVQTVQLDAVIRAVDLIEDFIVSDQRGLFVLADHHPCGKLAVVKRTD